MSIIQALKRINFRPLKKVPVVIYDRDEELLASFLTYDYTVFSFREETLQMPLNRLLFFFIYYMKAAIGDRSFKYSKRIALYASFIKCTAPKVVLTTIDTDQGFHSIAPYFKDTHFFAIQNGLRTIGGAVAIQGSRYGNILSFGAHLESIYTTAGVGFESIHPVGSLKAGLYKRDENDTTAYDICLVSNFREYTGDLKRFSVAIRRMSTFLSKYLKENSTLKLVIACAKDTTAERDFFQQQFSDISMDMPHKDETYATYALMDRSNVVVGFNSTALFEAYGWGKKAFFTNYSEDPSCNLGDSLPPQIFSSNYSYEDFADKLDTLIHMDDQSYKDLTRESQAFICHWNPDIPAHEAIQRILREKIEG